MDREMGYREVARRFDELGEAGAVHAAEIRRVAAGTWTAFWNQLAKEQPTGKDGVRAMLKAKLRALRPIGNIQPPSHTPPPSVALPAAPLTQLMAPIPPATPCATSPVPLCSDSTIILALDPATSTGFAVFKLDTTSV